MDGQGKEQVSEQNIDLVTMRFNASQHQLCDYNCDLFVFAICSYSHICPETGGDHDVF